MWTTTTHLQSSRGVLNTLKRRKYWWSGKIKLQTPYPARLRVFYSDGTRLYQNAAEATEHMASRGFPTTIIPAPTSPDQCEIQLSSTWQVSGDRRTGAPNTTDATSRREKKSSTCTIKKNYMSSEIPYRWMSDGRQPNWDTDSDKSVLVCSLI